VIVLGETVEKLGAILELIRRLDVPSPETRAEIARLERLLSVARTEKAARHLVDRIARLRRGRAAR
jgi:hypothetical protein